MQRVVYWHAPLWELLLVSIIVAVPFIWMVIERLRTPKPQDVFTAVDPALDQQPVFFYNQRQGLVCLNKVAQRFSERQEQAHAPDRIDTLIDLLAECFTEQRLTSKNEWPWPDTTFFAIPLQSQDQDMAGVFGVITVEANENQSRRLESGAEVVETIEIDTSYWIPLGQSLFMHKSHPYVQVQTRLSDKVVWRRHELSYNENLLLRYFLEHSNDLQLTDELFMAAWPDEPVEFGLNPAQRDRLRRLVYQLRQQIEPNPREPRYIVTIHGRGYAFYRDP